jgi:hypothetical protein
LTAIIVEDDVVEAGLAAVAEVVEAVPADGLVIDSISTD